MFSHPWIIPSSSSCNWSLPLRKTHLLQCFLQQAAFPTFLCTKGPEGVVLATSPPPPHASLLSSDNFHSFLLENLGSEVHTIRLHHSLPFLLAVVNRNLINRPLPQFLEGLASRPLQLPPMLFWIISISLRRSPPGRWSLSFLVSSISTIWLSTYQSLILIIT